MNKRNLIPDWDMPKAIILVWPEHLAAGRGSLLDFYKSFIGILSKFVEVKVLFCNGLGSFGIPKNLPSESIISFPKIGDIWIRDYNFISVHEDGEVIPIKTEYHPSYLKTEAEKRDGSIDNNIGLNLSKIIHDREPEYLSIGNYKILLDGGNIVFNGNGKAIVSNRIITDNENHFQQDIMTAMKFQLGIDNLHVIPTEPGDDTGHVDGLVRFMGPSTLLVSEYPYPWRPDQDFIDEDDYAQSRECDNSIANYFANLDFKVFRMPNGIPKKTKKFESAVGNYTNFLRVGEFIFIPEYGINDEDQEAKYALIEAVEGEAKIIGVPGCKDLARHGGVLNCITSQIY